MFSSPLVCALILQADGDHFHDAQLERRKGETFAGERSAAALTFPAALRSLAFETLFHDRPHHFSLQD
jgi:hypothetical protein